MHEAYILLIDLLNQKKHQIDIVNERRKLTYQGGFVGAEEVKLPKNGTGRP